MMSTLVKSGAHIAEAYRVVTRSIATLSVNMVAADALMVILADDRVHPWSVPSRIDEEIRAKGYPPLSLDAIAGYIGDLGALYLSSTLSQILKELE